MRGEMDKHGQMKISFGMIFSIILIITFLAFAFYAIRGFLGLQEDIGVKQFKDDLKTDINKVAGSVRSTGAKVYSVSDKFDELCITDSTSANIILRFTDGVEDWMHVKSLDAVESIKPRKIMCTKAVDGKIKLNIVKAYDSDFATINFKNVN
jgi:hypothetical protein